MSDAVKVLITSDRVAPLGLRFWDPVSRQLIGDGLEITASPTSGAGPLVKAFANRSATYVLRELPGLRDTEAGAGDAGYWATPPAPRSFTIAVTDQQRRFLPFHFAAHAPTKGVVAWPCPLISPPSAPPALAATAALFSTPTRDIPRGMAVLRARLSSPAGVPAAWAILEAQVNGGQVARGMANEHGTVAVIFAFPRSPVATVRVPLLQQTWQVQLRALYTPVDPAPNAPDLCAVLHQPAAKLWANSQQTQALTGATLTYGRELVLRTQQDTDTWLSDVWITPT